MTLKARVSEGSHSTLVDEQRLVDHKILQAHLARTHARIARRAAEAVFADIDASVALRRAAIATGVLQV